MQLNSEKNHLWKSGKIRDKLNDRDYLINVDDRLYRRNLVHIKQFLSNQNNPTKEIRIEDTKDKEYDDEQRKEKRDGGRGSQVNEQYAPIVEEKKETNLERPRKKPQERGDQETVSEKKAEEIMRSFERDESERF